VGVSDQCGLGVVAWRGVGQAGSSPQYMHTVHACANTVSRSASNHQPGSDLNLATHTLHPTPHLPSTHTSPTQLDHSSHSTEQLVRSPFCSLAARSMLAVRSERAAVCEPLSLPSHLISPTASLWVVLLLCSVLLVPIIEFFL
jgi:hypothetical protein